jgi:hypothetical protein
LNAGGLVFDKERKAMQCWHCEVFATLFDGQRTKFRRLQMNGDSSDLFWIGYGFFSVLTTSKSLHDIHIALRFYLARHKK